MKSHISPAHRDYSWISSRVAEAVLRSSYINRIASRIPAREEGLAGHPAEFPDVVYVLFTALAGTLGSQRNAASWLAEESNWYKVRKHAERRWEITLPKYGPTRGTCGYNFRRLADKHHLLFREEFRAAAIEQAQRQGCLMSEALTMNKPERKNVVIADGTVPKCRFRHKTYERLRKEGKHVPGASFFKEGGEDGKWVHGMKELLFVVRPDEVPNSRVILGTFPVTEGTYLGEAGLAVQESLRYRNEVPGFLGFRFDGAFRGKHIDELMKAGLSVVTPVPKSDKRRFLKEVTCSKSHVHRLYTQQGDFCEISLLDTGEEHTIYCKRVRQPSIAPRAKGGNFRVYAEIELACGAIQRERLDSTGDDQGFSLAERLRQHPPHTPYFKETYGYRADVESTNNNLDSGLYRQRMIVDTPERQALIMVGFCISRNAISQQVYEARLREGLLDEPPGNVREKPVAA
ncbi:hypothetical protein [Pseudarthrobacter sp. ATCC 49987]|uniref:hypothetical protein n=1 Tax=Pseudarthrobacter sp. ATCC 49987 TaxID=2698204 RepID=UPI0013718999|nr:hypothetical protein [Pseudarthrobacter sp. ATCC 49987]